MTKTTDGRVNNGGARQGAGRHKGEATKLVRITYLDDAVLKSMAGYYNISRREMLSRLIKKANQDMIDLFTDEELDHYTDNH